MIKVNNKYIYKIRTSTGEFFHQVSRSFTNGAGTIWNSKKSAHNCMKKWISRKPATKFTYYGIMVSEQNKLKDSCIVKYELNEVEILTIKKESTSINNTTLDEDEHLEDI